MKVLVVGAAGKTGRAVVEEALEKGHEVTAFVHTERDPGRSDVVVRAGDAADPTAVDAAMAGQDAVINTVGGRTPYRHTSLETDIATTIVASMKGHGTRRLIVTSSLGVGDSKAHTPFFTKIIVATFLRGSTADKANMEAVVRGSGLDWTITRPAVLSNGTSAGQVRVLDAGAREAAKPITRSSLADFLVASLTSEEHLRQTITLAQR